MAAVDVSLEEQAALLGARRSLVGIVTGPRTSDRIEDPAIVILNTGIVHRVGHHRMYVTLSRSLASAGRLVVRFDLSGVGDSPPRSDIPTLLLGALADIKEVLDSLERTRHVSRFVLVGLCSGADHAVLYANGDSRVVGLVLMDPILPPTVRYYFHYIRQRLGKPRNWMSVMRGQSGLFRLAASQLARRLRPQRSLPELTLQNLQFSPYLAQCYRTAARRRVRILSVFTSVSARHTYGKQCLDAFPELSTSGATRVEFFADSDHLFSADKDRERLFRAISDWLERA